MTRLHLSWLFLVGGALWGVAAASRAPSPGVDPLLNGFLGALMMAYVVWSLYWGIPLFWRFWRQHSHRFGGLLDRFSPLLSFALQCALCVAGAYFFSVFGGGIYALVRYMREQQGTA